jgi:hypothetical protein
MAGALAIGTSLSSGTAVVQAEPAPGTNDFAEIIDGFTVTFGPIKNAGTGMCLQPMDGSRADVPIVQMPCDSPLPPEQLWAFLPTVGSSTTIVNMNSHSCMYFNGPIQAGTQIFQALCDGTSNTWWTPPVVVRDVPDIAQQLRSRVGRRDSNLCIEATTDQPGLVMDVMSCDNVIRQLWNLPTPPTSTRAPRR